MAIKIKNTLTTPVSTPDTIEEVMTKFVFDVAQAKGWATIDYVDGVGEILDTQILPFDLASADAKKIGKDALKAAQDAGVVGAGTIADEEI